MIRARYALLVEKFHLTLPQIAALTERQISEIYFHERDEEGQLVLPAPDTSGLSKRDRLINKFNLALKEKLITKEKHAELRRQLDEKFPPMTDGNGAS